MRKAETGTEMNRDPIAGKGREPAKKSTARKVSKDHAMETVRDAVPTEMRESGDAAFLGSLTERLIGSGYAGLSREIRDALGMISGRIGQVDRGMLLVLSDDGQVYDRIWEWHDEGVKPRADLMAGTSGEGFRWMLGELNRSGRLSVSNISELPPEATAERALMKNLGWKSMAVVLLPGDGGTPGLLLFSAERKVKRWHESDLALISMVSGLFGRLVSRIKADESIYLSEQKYRALFENYLNPIIIAGDDGRVTDANTAAIDFLEKDLAEVTGRTIFEWVPQLRKVMETPPHPSRKVIETEIIVNGEAKHLLLTMVPFPVGGRTILYGIGQDITDLRRAQEQEALLAAIVQHSDEAIIGRDTKGRVTSWNGAAERLFGYQASEVLGSTTEFLVPEELREERALIVREVSDGHTISHRETKRRRKDGKTIDVSITVSPIRDRNGRLIGRSSQIHDISERRQMVEKIRYLASFTQENPQPIMEVRSDGSVAFANIAVGLALRRQGLPDRPELFFPEDFNGILKELKSGNDGLFYRETGVGEAIYGEMLYLAPDQDVIRIYAQDLSIIRHSPKSPRRA
jgi:PAS domain S-box-containing protein